MKTLLDNGIACLCRLNNGQLIVRIPGVAVIYRGNSLADAYAAYRDASE